jgi:hypothetical protein
LRQNYTKWKKPDQYNHNIPKAIWELIICGLAAGIGHPWAFVGATLSVAEGTNSSMVKILDAVVCL